MNRFKFRFGSVLRYREILEENKKRDFGVSLSHLDHEEKNLDRIEDTITDHEQLMEKSGKGNISARDLQNKSNFARHLDGKKEFQEKQVEKAEEELESKRTELVEATKEKKMFERLKERDHEAYDEELKKEERKLNDDFLSQRFKNRPER